jgi:glyoxylase-like metal-dependent hydrolase (beta-lactamase superfamily II)/rhodanese-related sulfurtransferase
MQIHSFRTPGLGDQTYLLEHEGLGVLIDPQRDIERFLSVAGERDVQLRWVLDTHLHNDYVSGAEAAARSTGAELVLPAAAAQAYRATPAFHLEDLPSAQGLTIRPIHTPGHTPEHTSYLVLIDGEEVALFSGGSLLVGSAGRPDLFGPERADTLARLQFLSLNRLAQLPADLELFPTHGAGSFCTASGASAFTSTIGDEVRDNPLLQLASAEALSEQLRRSPMPIPGFYRHMGPANTYGVQPWPTTTVPRIPVAEVEGRADVHLVDLRPREDQAKGLLTGSLAIELTDDFGSWAGWLVPWEEPVVLIANPDQDVEEAITQLRQIGFDSIVGVVDDVSGASRHHDFALVDLAAARALVQESVQVLDVRMPHERAATRLPGAAERFLPDLVTEGVPDDLDPGQPVLIACASGRRATIAASMLTEQGFADVRVLDRAGIPDQV